MFSQRQEELILAGKELRNLEYKASVSWNDTAIREKIVRSMVAMSNIRDGGSIIIGVNQQTGGTFIWGSGLFCLHNHYYGGIG